MGSSHSAIVSDSSLQSNTPSGDSIRQVSENRDFQSKQASPASAAADILATPKVDDALGSHSISSCPVDHTTMKNLTRSRDDAINPINNMPSLAQTPSPGQKAYLPLERTMSSIPKPGDDVGASDAAQSACPVAQDRSSPKESSAPSMSKSAATGQWEYPSPQQFYNALVRKGWETPEESVEMMVNIHNWINEEAWAQVRRWEERHDGGDRSMLARFQGRPQDLSPKARYHLMMGRLFPNYYGSVKPFDRHDWLVHRPVPKDPSSGYTSPSSNQKYTEHRYVIDYYSLPDDSNGNPVFSLDVRPAVDSVEAVRERLTEWMRLKKETWFSPAPRVTQGSSSSAPGIKVQEG